MKNSILSVTHETAKGLHEAGVMTDPTMRKFDKIMSEEKKQITKPFFDKTNYVFEYSVEDVYNFVNKTLDKEDLNNHTLDVCGFLLTELDYYKANEINMIALNAIESASIGAYNKRSVSAKKAAETRKKTIKKEK